MKTLCQKSGLPIWKSDLLMGFDLADEHPIFKAKRSLILHKDMVHRFSATENEFEKRLIFLATMDATYLVKFEYPACPSLYTMEKNFLDLMFLAQWTAFAEYKLAKIVAFPQYVIRKDNCNLESVKSWLQAIDAIREKVNKKELERDKNAALLQREMEIKKELNEANFYGKAFTPKLAKWALELCDITLRHADFTKWMKILCTPLNEAWIYNMEDLFEIREILQSGLPNLEENPQAISVMFQVNQLIKECRSGFTDFSSISGDNEVTDFEIIEEEQDPATADMIKKVHKINQHMLGVPTEKPRKDQYATKVEFLIAQAKWDLSQARQNKQLGESDV